MQKREKGYYWVRLRSEDWGVFVAEYNPMWGVWFHTGSEWQLEDSDVEVLSERLVPVTYFGKMQAAP